MSDLVAGFFAPWAVFAVVGGVHLALPARRVAGYVRDEHSGELLRYRLNGLLVLVVTVGTWFAVCAGGVIPWDWFWAHRWSAAAGALTLGLLGSALVVLTAPSRGAHVLTELYLGRRINPHMPAWLAIVATAVFFAGWMLSRGANLQKFSFKQDPERAFLGLVPKVLSDDERRVLCSGFWGLSRHVNYLGEIGMATSLALALGWPLVLGPWLYPLYYVALLVPRERADDRRCAQKYGRLWEQYRIEVPWRIVPRIY